MGTRCADHVTPLYSQKLALTSPTGGGRSVGIVRSRTKATEFFFFFRTSGLNDDVSVLFTDESFTSYYKYLMYYICFVSKAREVVDGVPGNDPLTVTTKKGTVTIKDVNDEAPTFNNREYRIVIPENVPDGTPLPHLDMVVHDPDIVS